MVPPPSEFLTNMGLDGRIFRDERSLADGKITDGEVRRYLDERLVSCSPRNEEITAQLGITS